MQAQGHLQGYKTGVQVKPLGQREGEEDFIELKGQELIWKHLCVWDQKQFEELSDRYILQCYYWFSPGNRILVEFNFFFFLSFP